MQSETSRMIFDSSTKDLFTPSSEDEVFLPSQSDINVAAFYTWLLAILRFDKLRSNYNLILLVRFVAVSRERVEIICH